MDHVGHIGRLLVLSAIAVLAGVGLTTPAQAASGEVFTMVAGSAATFYPRVHDGYRDATVVTWVTSGYATVSIDVLDRSGVAVRHEDAKSDFYLGSWWWDGKADDETNAPTGHYTVVLAGTVMSNGATETVTRQVRLATGDRTSTVSQRRAGFFATSTSSSPLCSVERQDFERTVDLDCWWGRAARATYGFSLPSNAQHVSWGVSGYQACCYSGSLATWADRPSSTSYRVHVKVTGPRAYVVERVRVTYSYRHRI